MRLSSLTRRGGTGELQERTMIGTMTGTMTRAKTKGRYK